MKMKEMQAYIECDENGQHYLKVLKDNFPPELRDQLERGLANGGEFKVIEASKGRLVVGFEDVLKKARQ
jgi:hypothetical protein